MDVIINVSDYTNIYDIINQPLSLIYERNDKLEEDILEFYLKKIKKDYYSDTECKRFIMNKAFIIINEIIADRCLFTLNEYICCQLDDLELMNDKVKIKFSNGKLNFELYNNCIYYKSKIVNDSLKLKELNKIIVSNLDIIKIIKIISFEYNKKIRKISKKIAEDYIKNILSTITLDNIAQYVYSGLELQDIKLFLDDEITEEKFKKYIIRGNL